MKCTGQRRREDGTSEKQDTVERFVWIAIGTSGCCEHGNEHSISIKCWEILE
jgi:hypothetical protein